MGALVFTGAAACSAGSVCAQQQPEEAKTVTSASSPTSPTPAASPTANAASPTTPTTPAAAAATRPAASTPSADTLKKARAGGFKPEVQKGVTKYCINDAETGTRFPTKRCYDEMQMLSILNLRQDTRDALQKLPENNLSSH